MTQRVVIVGGGISGLACAHHLHELAARSGISVEIKLFEATHHLGGVISTIQKDGFLMEGGPDSFISEKPWALDLVKRLGLEDEIIGTQHEFRKSFIVRDGKLVPVPEGFYLMAPLRLVPFLKSDLFSWHAKFRMALDLFIPKSKNNQDESVASFIRRRFGQEALERVGQAMVAGIYTSDPEQLSLRATFPQFLEMEKKYGSIIRGLKHRITSEARGPRYSLFLALRSGMRTLVDTLAKKLPAGCIEMDAPVRSIRPDSGSNRWKITYGRGNEIEADAVVLATGAPKMSDLVRGIDSALSNELEKIPYASVATVNLAYRRSNIQHPLDGFGFVVPEKENLSMVGCTFSSVKFPGRAPDGCVLLRAFIGGAMHPEVIEWNRAQIEASVKNDLARLLDIQGAPIFVSLDRYMTSMPQYHLGHTERVAKIESLANNHKGLYLAGNALHGIGIPDCVHQGELAAERILS